MVYRPQGVAEWASFGVLGVTLLHCELSDETLELIKESILFNCSARIEMDSTTYIPVGDTTEVGLLKFLQDADIPIHLLI